MEKRFTPADAPTGRELSGYCIKWNQPSNIRGVGAEIFAKDSLEVPPEGCSLYYQHKRENLLGSTKSGTLKLFPDDVGLRFVATLPVSAKKEAEAVRRGDIAGMSFGFSAKDEDRTIPGMRKILKATLHECSLVDKPAHSSTEIKIRSKQEDKRSWTDLILEYPLDV